MKKKVSWREKKNKKEKNERNLVSASVEKREKKKKNLKRIWYIWAYVILMQFLSFCWGDNLWLEAVKHYF